MLVLTRRSGESIQVGSAEVTVVSVAGGKVRLGIRAGDDVRIVRAELRSHDAAAAFGDAPQGAAR